MNVETTKCYVSTRVVDNASILEMSISLPEPKPEDNQLIQHLRKNSLQLLFLRVLCALCGSFFGLFA
jgi:hypothetical protein